MATYEQRAKTVTAARDMLEKENEHVVIIAHDPEQPETHILAAGVGDPSTLANMASSMMIYNVKEGYSQCESDEMREKMQATALLLCAQIKQAVGLA